MIFLIRKNKLDLFLQQFKNCFKLFFVNFYFMYKLKLF